MSFDERSVKLVAIAVESVEGLGREGSEFNDQLATSVIGKRDGRGIAKNGIYKERLLQKISVTSQVAISRRIHTYKLALRDARRLEGERRRRGGCCQCRGVGTQVLSREL